MADKKRWIVTLSRSRPLSEVQRDLEAAGFKVGDVLEEIGIVTGSCADKEAGRLKTIDGVAAVEPETKVDIGPPGQTDTW